MTTPGWIDPKISVGNILQILIIVVGVIGGYYNLRQDIAFNNAKIDKVDIVQKLEISHIRETLDRIITRLDARGGRTRRSDRLPGPARPTP